MVPLDPKVQLWIWPKLLNKPSIFENKNAEEDIKSFRDWHWQLCQYVTAVDEGFAGELQQLNDDPSKKLSMETASAETRHRSTKLYIQFAGFSCEESCVEHSAWNGQLRCL